MKRARQDELRSAIASVLNRRQVLGCIGAATAAALLPLGAFATAGAGGLDEQRSAESTLDDIFSLHPRYSQAIGYAKAPYVAVVAPDAADRQFVP
jgi:hypothetical protein